MQEVHGKMMHLPKKIPLLLLRCVEIHVTATVQKCKLIFKSQNSLVLLSHYKKDNRQKNYLLCHLFPLSVFVCSPRHPFFFLFNFFCTLHSWHVMIVSCSHHLLSSRLCTLSGQDIFSPLWFLLLYMRPQQFLSKRSHAAHLRTRLIHHPFLY